MKMFLFYFILLFDNYQKINEVSFISLNYLFFIYRNRKFLFY